MSETAIVACGQEVCIGCRVVKWNDPGGLSFYTSGKKYTERNMEIDTLRQEVKTFILHHSVTYTAKHTYTGLISRGLSVNFIIDDDDNDGFATIYQCLDIKDAGWSHAPLNGRGPGVEICYHPLVTQMPQAYSEANQKKYGVQPHEQMDDKIHGQKIKTYCPTEAQVKSVTALLAGFVELFPDVPAVFPRDEDCNVIKTTIENPELHEGFLAHFHVTRNKVDPLGFPFDQVEAEI